MIEIAILLLTAAIGATVARRFALPSIPLLLFAGWLLSLTGFRISETLLSKSLELGVAFLAFASGVELETRYLKHRVRPVLSGVLLQMGASGALVFLLAWAFGVSWLPALYLAVAFSVSSTLVGVRQLRRYGQTQEPFARYSNAMLVVQDLVVIVLIALLAASENPLRDWPWAAGGTLVLIAAALGLRWFVAQRLATSHSLDDENLLLSLLATLFTFLGVAHFLQLPIVVGAFCAGLVFSRFPTNGLVRGQLGSLTDFFAALFFIALAQLVVSPSLILLLEALLFTVVILISRFFLIYWLARRAGLDGRGSIESGLLLAQAGEYALVVGLIALNGGIFGDHEIALVSLVAAFTMMITPFVAHDRVASLLLHLRRMRRPPPEAGGWSDHVLMIGYGAGGKWVAHPLQQAGNRVVVVDDDPAVIEHLKKEGLACLRGNGTDPAVLQAAGIGRARAVLASPRRVTDGLKVLEHVPPGVPVVVRVFEDHEAEATRRAGGIPIRNSLAGGELFMEWFVATHAKEG